MATVIRHSLTVRLTHWLIAVSGILLLFSGFGQMPMYTRYKVVNIPLLSWSGDFELTLLLHNLSAIVFCAAVFFHMVYHTRRKEFGIMPRKGDLKESLQGLKAMFGMAEEPHHEKFQAKQRVIYGIFGINSLILIVTGLLKTYKNLGAIVIDPLLLQLFTMLHTVAAMTFLVLFLAHVSALLLKNHRPLIPSMISGKISKDYVRSHHPAWKVN